MLPQSMPYYASYGMKVFDSTITVSGQTTKFVVAAPDAAEAKKLIAMCVQARFPGTTAVPKDPVAWSTPTMLVGPYSNIYGPTTAFSVVQLTDGALGDFPVAEGQTTVVVGRNMPEQVAGYVRVTPEIPTADTMALAGEILLRAAACVETKMAVNGECILVQVGQRMLAVNRGYCVATTTDGVTWGLAVLNVNAVRFVSL